MFLLFGKTYKYFPIMTTSHRCNHSAMCNWILTYRPTKWHSNVFAASDDMSSLVTQVFSVSKVLPMKIEKSFRRLITSSEFTLLNMVIWKISAVFLKSNIMNEFTVRSKVWLQVARTPSMALEAGYPGLVLVWLAAPFLPRSR